MASSKELFLKSESTVKKCIEIVKSTEFEALVAFARAEFSQRNPTSEQSTGANNFINILFSLPIDEAPEPEWVDPGLKHETPVHPRDRKEQETNNKS